VVWLVGRRKIVLFRRRGSASYYVYLPKWWAEALIEKGVKYVDVRVEGNGSLVIVPLPEEKKVKT